MVLKISSNLRGAVETDAVGQVRDAVTQAPRSEAPPPAQGIEPDPVEQIAKEVAAGDIGRSAAVDRIMAGVLSSPSVARCPETLRREIEDALGAMLETDPHLLSLASAISPADAGSDRRF